MNPINNLKCEGKSYEEFANPLLLFLNKSSKKINEYRDLDRERFSNRPVCLPPTCMPTKICDPWNLSQNADCTASSSTNRRLGKVAMSIDNTRFLECTGSDAECANEGVQDPIFKVSDLGFPTVKYLANPPGGKILYLRDFDVYHDSTIVNLKSMKTISDRKFQFLNRRNRLDDFDKDKYIYGNQKIEYEQQYKGCADFCNKNAECGGFVTEQGDDGFIRCQYYSFKPNVLKQHIVSGVKGKTVYIKRCNRYRGFADYNPDYDPQPYKPPTKGYKPICIPRPYCKEKENFSDGVLSERYFGDPTDKYNNTLLGNAMKKQVIHEDGNAYSLDNLGLTKYDECSPKYDRKTDTCVPRCHKEQFCEEVGSNQPVNTEATLWLIIFVVLSLTFLIVRNSRK